MKQIFVTGANGKMGQALLPLLPNWQVVAPSSQMVNITNAAQTAQAIAAARPDVVLHLAAFTDVAGAEQRRAECWATNVIGTRNVATASLGARLVHFSTDYVFDGERGGYTETDTPKPSNHYALSKTVAEEAARHNPNVLVLRSSFKQAPWPYPMAFTDQFTSADYVDVIAAQMQILLSHLDDINPPDGFLHVATERKSIFDLATRRTPTVKPGSRLDAKVHIPPDVSLDTTRWQGIKQRLGILQWTMP